MLRASRAEVKKKINHDESLPVKIYQGFVLFFDTYLIEPVCTGIRFLHLVVIFVPVILAVPALWIGPRQKHRDNERTGTLWWHGFMVQAMEWAGPAFIKVSFPVNTPSDVVVLTTTARSMGRFPLRYLPD